jgi:predicted alpha/beta hydrolase family esterase
MGRVIVVPGLAVRTYAVEPVERLHQAGYDADLLPALAWRGVPVDLADYGRALAADIEAAGQPVDVLVGLSAGSQAAAIAASLTSLVRHLVLVSPTIEPTHRNTLKMLGIFLTPNPNENAALFSELLPDWSRAGPTRILQGFRSAVRLPLEHVLGRVSAELTVVHGDYDQLTTYDYAATLAAQFGGTLRIAPEGAHSWPTQDPEGFLRLVDDLLGVRR